MRHACLEREEFCLYTLLDFLPLLGIYSDLFEKLIYVYSFFFVSAPIDDGAVQRLRDLIVSFALSSLLLMRYSASTPLV